MEAIMDSGRTALLTIALLATSACSAGAGANSGGPAPAGSNSWAPSEYPQVLVGTWEEPGQSDTIFKLNPDGTCIDKFWDTPATPCSYTVTTGGALHPSPSASWILQIDDAKIRNRSFEIVAIDHGEFTVRDSNGTASSSRVPDDYVKDCVGSFAGCKVLTVGTCEEADVKCEVSVSGNTDCAPIVVGSADNTACLDFMPSACGDMPGCHLK